MAQRAVGPIAKRCEQVMRRTAKKYRAEIFALEIMPDHLPVLVEVDPQFGVHRLVWDRLHKRAACGWKNNPRPRIDYWRF